MKVKAIVAGLALALGAGSAQADLVTSALGGSPSELMLSVHDYTAGRTFVYDLGSSFEDFRLASGVLSDGFESWNLSALADFSGILAGITGGNDIRYNVVAYNKSAAGSNNASFGYLSTTNQSSATLNGLSGTQFTSGISAGSAKIETRFGNMNALVDSTNSGAVNASFTTTDPASTVWHAGSKWGNNLATGVAGLDNEGLIGIDLAFWHFGADMSTGTTTDADVERLMVGLNPGFFNLSANGVLTYGTPASAVPVPGALWLLGSALLGFIGLGSRKNKLAA